ncbi:S1 RNA-binding domain-containing protein [Clostridium intestinale]
MSRKKINHPSEVLKVGDVVKAKIINVDKEKRKIGLSSKVLE